MSNKRYIPLLFNLIIITLTILASAACASNATTNTTIVGKLLISQPPKQPKPSPIRLACEPLTFVNLPMNVCAGTDASNAYITAHGTCVCRNHSYIAVPNGLGRTCVHRHAVLLALSRYANAMEMHGVPEPKIEHSLESPMSLMDSGGLSLYGKPNRPELEFFSQIRGELDRLAKNGSTLNPLQFQRRLDPIVSDTSRIISVIPTEKRCVVLNERTSEDGA